MPTEQRSHQVTLRTKSAALLRDLLFDEAGDPMIPTHATKHGVRYRYYVSQPYRRGIAKPPAGAIIRVPAAEIEGTVIRAVTEHLHNRARSDIREDSSDQNVVSVNVARVEVRNNHLAVWLKNVEPNQAGTDATNSFDQESSLASDSLVQTAVKEVARDSAAAFCRTAGCPSDQSRAASGTTQIDCPWPCVAGRCRVRRCDCRGHRQTP